MTVVVDLIVRAHEIDARMVHKDSRIAVIPLAIKLYEIPVVSVQIYGISLDHQVGNSGTVEKHFRTGKINIAVTVASCKSSGGSSLI